MLKYLLDTNMVIDVMKRRPIEVLSQFNDNAGRMALSAITLSKLHHGAIRSQLEKVGQPIGVN
jgi:tRNA(fMet)-specific endonuclease VapC